MHAHGWLAGAKLDGVEAVEKLDMSGRKLASDDAASAVATVMTMPYEQSCSPG